MEKNNKTKSPKKKADRLLVSQRRKEINFYLSDNSWNDFSQKSWIKRSYEISKVCLIELIDLV